MECPKCGEKLYEMAEFCDACGCDLRQHKAETIREAKVYSGENEDFFEYHPGVAVNTRRLKKKRDKKGMVISLILVTAMLVVFGLVGAFVYRSLHKTPYEKKVDNLVSIMNGDVTTFDGLMKALFPKFIRKDVDALIKAQCEDDGLDYEEQMIDANTAVSDAVKSKLNTLNYDFSYNIKSERKLGAAELEDVSSAYTTASKIFNTLTTTGETYRAANKIKTYEAYMKLIEDFTTVKFTEGYELEVEFIAKDNDKNEKERETTKLIVVQIDGEWMIDFMNYLDKLSGMFN